MKAWYSLRVRLISTYLVIALFMLIIAVVLFWRVGRDYADSVEQQRQFSYYVQVHNYLTTLPDAAHSADQVLELLQKAFPEVLAEVLSPPFQSEFETRRASLAGSPRTPNPSMPNDLLFEPLNRPPDGEPDRWLASYMTTAGPVTFQFTVPPASQGGLFRTFMLQVFAVLGSAFALAGLIGWWLSHWLSRPILVLSAATGAAAEGDYAKMVDRVGVSELDELAEQFNRMLLCVRESLSELTVERDVTKQYVADAAHEFKTPLATLRAYTELLAERPDRLQLALPTMGRQVDRMEYMVAGLLDIASISEGIALRLETRDLVQAIKKLEPSLHDMAADYGQRLKLHIPKLPIMVRLDEVLLMRLLNNLVDNACKYAQEGGRVGVWLHQEGHWAVLRVVDQGRGISKADLPHVFERFHRGIETDQTKGSGLGLAIVRSAVQRLGGQIEVESRVGVGSTFRVQLPLAQNGKY